MRKRKMAKNGRKNQKPEGRKTKKLTGKGVGQIETVNRSRKPSLWSFRRAANRNVEKFFFRFNPPAPALRFPSPSDIPQNVPTPLPPRGDRLFIFIRGRSASINNSIKSNWLPLV